MVTRSVVFVTIVNINLFFANKETSIEESYRKKYKNHSLENIILFRSGPHASSYIKGMDFSNNARALFEYMLQEGFNKKYELVWLVKNLGSLRVTRIRKM